MHTPYSGAEQGSDPEVVRAVVSALDGREMMDELSSWPCGFALWEVFLSIKDWVLAPGRAQSFEQVAERAGLLAKTTSVTDELRTACDRLTTIALGSHAENSTSVTLACRAIARWSEDRQLIKTQFYFTSVAAASSLDARSIYDTGKLARDLALWNSAEIWLACAARTAKLQGDRFIEVLAVLGIGNVFIRQGEYRRARGIHESALLLARRYHLSEMAGKALHDLFVIAVELGDFGKAEEYATEALAAYGPSHRSVPALAHDLAYFWLEQGFFGRAVTVFKALLPQLNESNARHLRVLANLARATAGESDQHAFLDIWTQAWRLIPQLESRATLAPALADLAEGALSLNDRARASYAATCALEVARERGEIDIVARAERVLGSHPEPAKELPDGRSQPPHLGDTKNPTIQEIRSRLVDQLIQSLSLTSGSPTHWHKLKDCSLGIVPSPAAEAEHSTFSRDAWSGQVVEYVAYGLHEDPAEPREWLKALHFQLEGPTSFNRATRSDVPPPHVHDPTVPGGVRAARPDEIPRRRW